MGVFDFTTVGFTPHNLPSNYRNSPKYTVTTGDVDVFQEALLTQFAKDQAKDAYRSRIFKGSVMYSSTITRTEFEKMYDDAFYNWVYESTGSPGALPTTITKSHVYVLELCSCLPQIKHEDFLQKINEAGAQIEEQTDLVADSLRKAYETAITQNKMTDTSAGSSTLKDLKVMERYPVVYSAGEVQPKYKEIISVSFQDDGDFSYGKVLPLAAGAS